MRHYGIAISERLKKFTTSDGIAVIQHGKKALRRHINEELNSGGGALYPNKENALETASGGSMGGLWIMP